MLIGDIRYYAPNGRPLASGDANMPCPRRADAGELISWHCTNGEHEVRYLDETGVSAAAKRIIEGYTIVLL